MEVLVTMSTFREQSMNVKASEASTLFIEMDKIVHLSDTDSNESMPSTTSEKSKRTDSDD